MLRLGLVYMVRMEQVGFSMVGKGGSGLVWSERIRSGLVEANLMRSGGMVRNRAPPGLTRSVSSEGFSSLTHSFIHPPIHPPTHTHIHICAHTYIHNNTYKYT